MRERLIKLRAIVEAQAELALSQIDIALAELDAATAEVLCTSCGETDKDAMIDSSAMGDTRRTCGTCGVTVLIDAPDTALRDTEVA